MNHSKLTKYAFNLADVVSWFFVIVAVLTLAFAFTPPLITTWSFMELSPSIMVSLETINSLLGGIGFYLLIKRKIYGFALIIIYVVANLVFSKYPTLHVLYYSLILLFIVGLPWAMSFKEVRNVNKT